MSHEETIKEIMKNIHEELGNELSDEFLAAYEAFLEDSKDDE